MCLCLQVKAEEQKKEGQEEKKEEVIEEIVLKVDMHCEACARRVQKSLRRFEGTYSSYDMACLVMCQFDSFHEAV